MCTLYLGKIGDSHVTFSIKHLPIAAMVDVGDEITYFGPYNGSILMLGGWDLTDSSHTPVRKNMYSNAICGL